ncbi:MAG: hypothetical protein IVW53_09670 [Chloroflexi bacterium]|nr:hypothetical protein [Chloroflexota bacterium]
MIDPRPPAAHDDHGHDVALGPPDWAAWGAGLLGVALGLAVWICLAVATG